MYIYIYLYIYIHNVYTYIHTYIHTYIIYIYIHIYLHIYIKQKVSSFCESSFMLHNWRKGYWNQNPHCCSIVPHLTFPYLWCHCFCLSGLFPTSSRKKWVYSRQFWYHLSNCILRTFVNVSSAKGKNFRQSFLKRPNSP